MKLSDLLTNTTTERDRLKPSFNLGEIPTSQDFHDIIDGLFQIQGNTLYKDDHQGLSIQAGSDAAKSVLLFYDDPAQEPAWSLGIQNGFHLNNNSGQTSFSVLPNGKVGIGTTSPTEQLQVMGNASLYDGGLTFNGGALNQPQLGVLRWNEYPDNQTAFAGAFMQFNGQENYFQLFTNDETKDYEHLRVYRNGHLTLQPQGSGNVGIGTTTPTYKLQVEGDIFADGWLRTTGGYGLYFEPYGGGWYMFDNSWIRSYGGKNIYHDKGVMRTDGRLEVGENGGTFAVSNGGNVGINNPSPTYPLEINGNVRINNANNTTGGQSGHLYFHSTSSDFARIYSEQVTNNQIRMVIETGDDGNQDYVVIRNSHHSFGPMDIFTAHRNYVRVNGRLDYQTIQQISDERFKQNITPLDTHQVDKLYQLQGTKYQFRTEEFQEKGFAEGDYLGFLAQEVQALYPELVSEDEEGYLSINYTGLIPVIVESNKQQQKRIEVLETQLAALISS